MNTNLRLEKLYRHYWNSFITFNKSQIETNITNPLLLSVDEQPFKKADIKVMFCLNENLMYLNSCLSFNQTLAESKNFIHRARPAASLLQALEYYQKEFKEQNPDKHIYFIYQNLFKIGRNDLEVGTTSKIRIIENTYFPVFLEELIILQPDIIIFFTGSLNDFDIKLKIPDATFCQLVKGQHTESICSVSSSYLPKKSIRTYHPAHFWQFFPDIKQEISNMIKL